MNYRGARDILSSPSNTYLRLPPAAVSRTRVTRPPAREREERDTRYTFGRREEKGKKKNSICDLEKVKRKYRCLLGRRICRGKQTDLV